MRPGQGATRADVVICFGFERDRIRRQPWHVARGIAQGLQRRGRDVTLITDAAAPPDDECFAVAMVDRLFLEDRPAPALCRQLRAIGPERIFVVIGAHELLHGGRFRLGPATWLVLASGRFRVGEILRLGPADLWRERQLLGLVLLGSLVPGVLLRRGLARSGAAGLVFSAKETLDRFARLGVGPGIQLVPQVEPVPTAPVTVGPRGPATILYAGPPLALRGAVLALRAFERARAAGLDARLVLLLRPDGAAGAMARLVRLVDGSRWRADVTVVRDMLTAAELRRHLAAADVHLLPFRLTVSDAPLVVIEAGLTGRPVVVLDLPGVSEFARAFGGIVARHPRALPGALARACELRPRRPPAPEAWTRWERAVLPLLELGPAGPDRLRTIGLIGIDGAGKTTLAQALRLRLAAAGHPTIHVWTRFRNYLSKPLLGLARLTGHNRKVASAGVTVGLHDFAGVWWLARPFLALQRLDLHLDAWFRVRPAARRGLVVMDRCLLDQLVDVAADTGLHDRIVDELAPRLFDLLPQPARIVLVDREPVLIGRSRPDALADPKLLLRRQLYHRLAERLNLPVIANDGPIEEADRALDRLVGLDPQPTHRRARG